MRERRSNRNRRRFNQIPLRLNPNKSRLLRRKRIKEKNYKTKRSKKRRKNSNKMKLLKFGDN